MSLWTSPADERGLSLSGMTLHKHLQLPVLLSLDNATLYHQCCFRLFAFTYSFCRGCLHKPFVEQLHVVFDEMVMEGLQLFSRKLLHEDLGSRVLTTLLHGFTAQLLTLLETGITRLVCFPACYSLTLFSSQETFASNKKKG